MRKQWTEKELRRLKRLAGFGYSDAEIASKLGRSQGSVVAKRHLLQILIIPHKKGVLERLMFWR